jgi:hypothetical protein
MIKKVVLGTVLSLTALTALAGPIAVPVSDSNLHQGFHLAGPEFGKFGTEYKWTAKRFGFEVKPWGHNLDSWHTPVIKIGYVGATGPQHYQCPELPLPTPTPPVVEVPEPLTFTLFIFALFALWLAVVKQDIKTRS